jgi:dynein heavy chain
MYSNICPSLFEKDKLLFSFLLCTTILQEKGQLDPMEWRFFMVGKIEPMEGSNTSSTRLSEALLVPPSWMSEKSWKEVTNMSKLPTFRGFAEEFVERNIMWKANFVDALEPHNVPLPGGLY